MAYGFGSAPLVQNRAPRCSISMETAETEKPTLKCEVRKLPRSAIALDIVVPKAMSQEIHLKTLKNLAKNAQMKYGSVITGIIDSTVSKDDTSNGLPAMMPSNRPT